jgi:23S rRNA pseudouridine1911/1915/1917 synthase
MTPRPKTLSTREWVAPKLTAPRRLDHYLIREGIHPSRSFIKKLILAGDVTVNGRPVKPSHSVHPGDRIRLTIPEPVPLEIHPEAIQLDILFEDPYLVVLNKPAGLVVHPAPGNYSGTLVHALLHHCRDLSGIGGRERPGIVHRLDKGTSGIMVVAKTDDAHRNLSKQFSAHTIRRTYLALVLGTVKKGPVRIELPIGRDRKDRKKISPRTARPRQAVTVVRVVRRFREATLVEAKPETGRTHQIRVHLANLGHPILGDRTYGGIKVAALKGFRIDRPMLHAQKLGFTHPLTSEAMEFEAPPPPDMERIIHAVNTGSDRTEASVDY